MYRAPENVHATGPPARTRNRFPHPGAILSYSCAQRG